MLMVIQVRVTKILLTVIATLGVVVEVVVAMIRAQKSNQQVKSDLGHANIPQNME